jgi:cob(I)alamin adenosyltransferase
MDRGLIEVYMGTGKGKTTAALGLCLRAVGNGFNCSIVQFMKSPKYSGECRILSEMDNVSIYSYGSRKLFTQNSVPDATDFALAREALNTVFYLFEDDSEDVIILDELTNALYYNLINDDDIKKILAAKPDNIELVITGRKAPDYLLEAADLVSEIKEIKHPYQKGIPARKGIEY